MYTNIRNVAIIAHVDHGKTTLVDRLLQHTKMDTRHKLEDRVLDSNELEKERGITILSKNTAVEYKNCRVNIVDTPGHADFGGEVERILSMVDAVLLVVDAVEGPMPQTRFVTSKAFEAGLNPLVVINKIDRPEARPYEIASDVLELFDDLDATDKQLDFPIVYASATENISGTAPDKLTDGMGPLLDLILESIPPPQVERGAFQMQISTLDYSPYEGAIGIGRIYRGSLRPREKVTVVSREGVTRKAQISSIYATKGLERVELDLAEAGDIVCVTGVRNVGVSDTLCDPRVVDSLPPLRVDEPTLTMTFGVNTSPFVGKSGKFLTSRQLAERLFTEASHNVALRVEATEDPERFKVSGRGELHLSVLIETMRREGYELAVSRPTVVTRMNNGATEEPFDSVVLEFPSIYQGKVMQVLGERKSEFGNVHTDTKGNVRITFTVATRGLLGFRNIFSSITSGHGIMTFAHAEYRPFVSGLTMGRQRGVMVSKVEGKAVAYALFNLQNRGRMLVDPGTEVYQGMIVGIHNRSNDLIVNPSKEKKMTNIRAAANDENILLTPPLRLSLEQALEIINEDELVEVTPNATRLRKR